MATSENKTKISAGELSPKEERLEAAKARLPERERFALQAWYNSTKPAFAKPLQESLYQLYLTGHNCEEIRKLNPQYDLGSIVQAKVEWDWDVLRDEHRKALLRETTARLEQSTLETVHLMCDIMAATKKLHSEKLQKYLQSGNVKDLEGAFMVTNFKDLKAVVESLVKLRGGEVSPERPADSSTGVPEAAAALPQDQPISAQVAADALAILLGKQPKSKEN